MNPIPCAHCGLNFMRQTPDPEAPKLCNNCFLREEKRNPKKGKIMETIDILIKCPKEVHTQIEEFCLNNGLSLTQYFLDLHLAKGIESLEKQTKSLRETMTSPDANIKKSSKK